MIGLLKKYDFKTFTLSNLTIYDQAKIFSGAKVIITPHGVGLSNLIFCKPGTKVLEIFSPNLVYPVYWYISNILDLEYGYLIGEGNEIKDFPEKNLVFCSENIYVNINKLKAILEYYI